MRVEDLFTPESTEAFRRLTREAMGPGQALMEQYRTDREAQLEACPDLKSWIAALEDGELVTASDPGLWSRLIEQGFITCPAGKGFKGM